MRIKLHSYYLTNGGEFVQAVGSSMGHLMINGRYRRRIMFLMNSVHFAGFYNLWVSKDGACTSSSEPVSHNLRKEVRP